jgi:hypothetical protein
MRALVLACLFALASTPALAQTAPATADELVADFDQRLARGEALVAEIGALHARDQFLRELIMAGFQRQMSGETRQAYIGRTRHHFDAMSAEGTARLSAILETISWEDLTALSPRAADQAFSLISHSNDLAFKRRMIAEFEPLARSGRMLGDQVAQLVDDVAVTEGRPQVYGTNFECRDGVYRPKPTEAPEQLNERRAALGMNTIEEYTVTIRQMYGECPAGYSGN